MTNRSRALVLVSSGISLLLPIIALAASSRGIVPCGVSSGSLAATQCQACNVVELLQNIITFMLELAIPVAVAMFAYGGFLYFTSGASLGAIGGSENISKAKKIFQNAIFGFLVALTGWLVINTILNLVLDAAQYPSGSWFKVDCVSDSSRLRSENIGDVLLKDIGLAPTADVIPVCDDGLAYNSATKLCESEDGKTKESPDTTTKPGITYQSGIDTQIPTASGVLNNLISCIGTITTAQISSISDSRLEVNGGTKTWAECRAGECIHAKNSCHYGGKTCGDRSYAVDLVGNNSALYSAATSCHATFVLNEGDHVHASVGDGCGCDGGD